MSLNVGKYKDRDKYLEESIAKVDQMSVLVQEILALSKLQEETLTKRRNSIRKSSSRVEQRIPVIITRKRTSA